MIIDTNITPNCSFYMLPTNVSIIRPAFKVDIIIVYDCLQLIIENLQE